MTIKIWLMPKHTFPQIFFIIASAGNIASNGARSTAGTALATQFRMFLWKYCRWFWVNYCDRMTPLKMADSIVKNLPTLLCSIVRSVSGITVEVWEWANVFLPQFMEYVITYPIKVGLIFAKTKWEMNTQILSSVSIDDKYYHESYLYVVFFICSQ